MCTSNEQPLLRQRSCTHSTMPFKAPLCLLILVTTHAYCSTVLLGQSTSDEWSQKYTQAIAYVSSDKQVNRDRAIDLYNNVLAAKPPREIQLFIRLQIGSRMTILYDERAGEPSMEEEAIPYYEAILRDFSDWPMHYDLMVAEIHLGDLYRLRPADGRTTTSEQLYLEVIDVPEDSVVFDNPKQVRFNADSIARAKAHVRRMDNPDAKVPASMQEALDAFDIEHRQRLMEQRRDLITNIRKAAINALAYANEEIGYPEITIGRLQQLKARRPTDVLFQATLEERIKYYEKRRADKIQETLKNLFLH